jgi:hypothetical protein
MVFQTKFTIANKTSSKITANFYQYEPVTGINSSIVYGNIQPFTTSEIQFMDDTFYMNGSKMNVQIFKNVSIYKQGDLAFYSLNQSIVYMSQYTRWFTIKHIDVYPEKIDITDYFEIDPTTDNSVSPLTPASIKGVIPETNSLIINPSSLGVPIPVKQFKPGNDLLNLYFFQNAPRNFSKLFQSYSDKDYAKFIVQYAKGNFGKKIDLSNEKKVFNELRSFASNVLNKMNKTDAGEIKEIFKDGGLTDDEKLSKISLKLVEIADRSETPIYNYFFGDKTRINISKIPDVLKILKGRPRSNAFVLDEEQARATANAVVEGDADAVLEEVIGDSVSALSSAIEIISTTVEETITLLFAGAGAE